MAEIRYYQWKNKGKLTAFLRAIGYVLYLELQSKNIRISIFSKEEQATIYHKVVMTISLIPKIFVLPMIGLIAHIMDIKDSCNFSNVKLSTLYVIPKLPLPQLSGQV